MSAICPTVAPGQPLTSLQKTGLEWVARLQGGRDVVLAIDLTESVGLNDEGRIRLRQIVEDSLESGDTVYVVPFATTVNPLSPNFNPLTAENSIHFKKKEDLERILQLIPFQPNLNLQNTDIQRAELTIYQGLANLNQCRLANRQIIKPQSVVWITDAPLFSQSPTTSEDWTETPADSPFRVANSLETQQRLAWLQALPLHPRSLSIKSNNQQDYKLTVVDLPATVQEFCTPAPGGKETCLVTPYLVQKLTLPILILAVLLLICSGVAIKFYRVRKKWKLIVDFAETTQIEEDKICFLADQQRIAIGEYESSCSDSIDTPGSEIRAYLVRRGEKLYLEPTGDAPIYYNGKEITKKVLISSSRIRLNCPNSKQQDYEMTIVIYK